MSTGDQKTSANEVFPGSFEKHCCKFCLLDLASCLSCYHFPCPLCFLEVGSSRKDFYKARAYLALFLMRRLFFPPQGCSSLRRTMVVPFEKVNAFFFSFFVSISASELDNDPKPTCPAVDGGDAQKIPAMALAPESKDQTVMLGERTFNCCYPGEPQRAAWSPFSVPGAGGRALPHFTR